MPTNGVTQLQCWDVLESKYQSKRMKRGADQVSLPLAERFGHTMSSAGGAITVTSFTDIVGKLSQYRYSNQS